MKLALYYADQRNTELLPEGRKEMKTVRKKKLFLWTLRGKPYYLLAAGSLVILLAVIGVLL